MYVTVVPVYVGIYFIIDECHFNDFHKCESSLTQVAWTARVPRVREAAAVHPVRDELQHAAQLLLPQHHLPLQPLGTKLQVIF